MGFVVRETEFFPWTAGGNLSDVIPAKAGIHFDLLQVKKKQMDSRFRGNDASHRAEQAFPHTWISVTRHPGLSI